jgi:hypothetical protein
MWKTFATLVLIATAGASTGALGATATSAAPAGACTQTGYTKNCSGCKHLPGSGSFSLKVPGANVAFRGKGSSGSAHTTLCFTRVAAPVQSKGGVGVKVSATGPFKPLHVKHGKLYRYNPASGKDKKVKAVTKAGIYQVVP